jgi:uncharacterized protein (TIGR03437 family)
VSTGGVVDPWTYSTDITAGEWVTVFGSQLASGTSQKSFGANQLLPTSLGDTTVFFNGVPAPLNYVGSSQVSALVPMGTPAGEVAVVVRSQGLFSAPVIVQSHAARPAIYAIPQAGSSPLRFEITAVAPLTGELVGASETDGRVKRGAQPGETIDLYATGLGATTTPFTTEQVFSGAFPLAVPPTIQIGSNSVSAVFAGLVSPGLYLIRVVVPDSATGDLPVVVMCAGISSPANVVLRVAP